MDINPAVRSIRVSLGVAAVAVLASALPLGAEVRPGVRAKAPAGGVTIDEFPVPTGGSRPYTIVAGPDGALWFTESNGNKIGRISTAGEFSEYDVPTGKSGPYGIAPGVDGNIWFTERFGDQIGRLDIFDKHISEFPIPTPFAQAWEIAPGADGLLWFTEEDVHQIGVITTDGSVLQEVPIGTFGFPTGIAPGVDGNMWFTIEIGDSIGQINGFGQINTFPYSENQTLPWDITPGPDGNLWFSELAGRAIGRITPAGSVVEFPIPGDFSGIAGVSAGWDGNIWYTENDTNHVGSIDLAGSVLPKYDTGLRPLCITPGPDGNMWFTIADGNAIGRVNIAQPNAGHVLSTDAGFSPRRRLMKMGDTAKWMFLGPNAHSVVDSSGLGLFDSGSKPMVSYFNHVFIAASTYHYEDTVPPSKLVARISVPLEAPPSGTVGAPFPLVWASTDQGADIVFDVQVRLPGDPDFVLWQTTALLGGHYTPRNPGKYQFRARMRDTVSGAATGYSPPAVVNVR